MANQTEQLNTYLQSYFNVNDSDLVNLSKLFQIEHMQRGEFLTRIGDQSCSLSIIAQGHVRMYSYHNGKEITQWIASPGEFVTDIHTLIFKSESRFEIQAISDIVIYSIPQEDYANIKNTIGDWYEIERLFLSKCFATLENRVTSLLAFSAEERYQFFYGLKRELFNQVPLNQLASMLGMTPETLSRIRAKSIS